MKLFTNWPSKFYWTLWLGANLAYKEKWQKDLEAVNNRIMEVTGASSLTVSFPEESDLDVDLSLDFDTLNNDEKIFRLFQILREFGLFGFEAELMARSNAGPWDAYVAYYEYSPAQWTGIKRVYISCSECKSLVRRINPEDYYTVFDSLLWVRWDNKIQEEGGVVYVDETNRSVMNKEPVLWGVQEEDDGSLQN